VKTVHADIAVVGGGPAGLAAALEASRLGKRAIIIERDLELGGILQQCIHDGFGIHRFKKRMSGTEYAQTFIDMCGGAKIEVLLDTMALEVKSFSAKEKVVHAVNKTDGMMEIRCGAVILAMGCRERTASQALIYGERPAGVMTAGQVQRFINIEGKLPGKTAVILGSGDIGLIMARRMHLEGITVKGVYEVMSSPGGLTRNIVQCLDDFGIPLHLSSTVSEIHGKKRLEGVTVCKVDEKMKPIAGTEEIVPCDLLALSVGLIPENELTKKVGAEIDPKTKGPVLDSDFMTSVPGIFACGNVAVVFDLVDYVSASGEMAARGASSYLDKSPSSYLSFEPVEPSGNVSFIVPQRLRKERGDGKRVFFLRVKKPAKASRLSFVQNGSAIFSKKCRNAAPPEMLCVEFQESGEGGIRAEME
jgi:NADPH-dependent 2,4-dienoyl-CoA reductase/sulfur reductase-like enzyme